MKIYIVDCVLVVNGHGITVDEINIEAEKTEDITAGSIRNTLETNYLDAIGWIKLRSLIFHIDKLDALYIKQIREKKVIEENSISRIMECPYCHTKSEGKLTESDGIRDRWVYDCKCGWSNYEEIYTY